MSVDAAAADEVEEAAAFLVSLWVVRRSFHRDKCLFGASFLLSTSRINVLFLGFFLFFLNIILDKQLQRQFPSATQNRLQSMEAWLEGVDAHIGLKLFKNFFIVLAGNCLSDCCAALLLELPIGRLTKADGA